MQKAKKDNRAKHWCATVNDKVNDRIKEKFLYWIKCQEMWAFQEEIGEAGNKHIQAYCCLTEAKLGSKLIAQFPGIHWEVARAPIKAYNYCLKEDSRVPGGLSGHSDAKPKPIDNKGGGGGHWRVGRDMVRNGASMDDLVEAIPDLAMRYRSVWLDEINRRERKADLQDQIEAMEKDEDGMRTQLAECHILWGPPGTGKTWNNRRKALQKCKDENLRLYEAKDKKWFQDYDGEEIILLQDITPMQYEQSFLLQIMDGHRVWFPCKGGGGYGNLKYVFMDSNYDPLSWFTPIGRKPSYDEQERAQAVLRRAGEGNNVIYVPNSIIEDHAKSNGDLTLYEKLMKGGLKRREVRINRGRSATLCGLRAHTTFSCSVTLASN